MLVAKRPIGSQFFYLHVIIPCAESKVIFLQFFPQNIHPTIAFFDEVAITLCKLLFARLRTFFNSAKSSVFTPFPLFNPLMRKSYPRGTVDKVITRNPVFSMLIVQSFCFCDRVIHRASVFIAHSVRNGRND